MSFEYQSKEVISNQQGVHQNLRALVRKHLDHAYQKPIREHNREAYRCLCGVIQASTYPYFVMDSGCGTGMSTRVLAEENPDALVVGIDQSEHRLSKSDEPLANQLMLQANCEDIWRLLLEQPPRRLADGGIRVTAHYLLYPNPWPKAHHLKRRWHGHPVFPVLPALAPKTILRSNWRMYLEEFNIAWALAAGSSGTICGVECDQPLTLFEKKYHGSGQALFELVVSGEIS